MQYTFLKTTTHYVTVEAASQAEAEALVNDIPVYDDEVDSTTDDDWQLVTDK